LARLVLLYRQQSQNHLREETMSGGSKLGKWGKTAALVCAVLLAVSMLRPGTHGMRLAIGRDGVSFNLDMAFVKIAFDFGQSCSKSDSCRKMMG
jgi:hypothetical protein